MFIRVVKKQRNKNSRIYRQYSLVQSSRIDGKVKQNTVLYLGSDPLLDDSTNRALVLAILKSKIFGQPELFPDEDIPAKVERLALNLYEKYLIRYDLDGSKYRPTLPPLPDKAEYEPVDLKGLQVKDVRQFGAEHLCKEVLEKLDIASCLYDSGFSKAEVQKGLISIAGRAIYRTSELKTSQILKMNSELQACYGYDDPISHKQLYAAADKLYELKSKIDRHLYQKVSDLFDLEDKLVIYDLSNTYFETNKGSASKIAKYGKSKEKRNDCPIVVFTGVINRQGFIRHSRIYEGNKADSDTLQDMLEDLEKHSREGMEKTVVMDAGIATEENLRLLNVRGYKYVCVSRRRIKDYPVSIHGNTVSVVNKSKKNKVSLAVFKARGQNDTWMYVQSDEKHQKERSMSEKLSQRFEQHLQQIERSIHVKNGTKKIGKVWERIGRAKEKNKGVSSQYRIMVEENNGIASSVRWYRKQQKVKQDKEKGIYFIRTNYDNPKEKQLWDIYNTIREVESTFRCLKTDLNIRPVHHQNDERIESHIYLTILAYQLVNTIRYMLKQREIHYDWNNILRIMSTHTIQSVVLNSEKKDIHLRIPSTPIQEVRQIYQATSCRYTQTPTRKSVVYH